MVYWEMKRRGYHCFVTNTDYFPLNTDVYQCKVCKTFYFNHDLIHDECDGRVYESYIECAHSYGDLYEDFSLLSIDFDTKEVSTDEFKVIKASPNSLVISLVPPLEEDLQTTNNLVGKCAINSRRYRNWLGFYKNSKVKYCVVKDN